MYPIASQQQQQQQKSSPFFTICKDSQKLLKSHLAAKQLGGSRGKAEWESSLSPQARMERSPDCYLQQLQKSGTAEIKGHRATREAAKQSFIPWHPLDEFTSGAALTGSTINFISILKLIKLTDADSCQQKPLSGKLNTNKLPGDVSAVGPWTNCHQQGMGKLSQARIRAHWWADCELEHNRSWLRKCSKPSGFHASCNHLCSRNQPTTDTMWFQTLGWKALGTESPDAEFQPAQPVNWVP